MWRSHLEEVDDERASIAQVVHHLEVIDVAVHRVAELETQIQTLGMEWSVGYALRYAAWIFTVFCDRVY